MQDEEELIADEVDAFLADPRTIRYEHTDSNMNAMLTFLGDHGLQITHRNLLFAYDNLQDTLELTPFREPIPAPPQPKPAPTPTVQPPPVVARARTFVAFRNGQPITGNVRSL